MEAPARIGAFPSLQARHRYFEVYDAAMAQGPEPAEVRDFDTRFGITRVYRYGPDHGPPIVLLHAFWATSAMWAPNVAALALNHPVYSIDIIGQPGASVQISVLRTPRDCFLWLDSVLMALALCGVHLVGCSYGGWLAFNQAINSSGRLSTLTLIEPANVFARSSVRFKFTACTLLPAVPRKLTRYAMAWAFGHPDGSDPMNQVVNLIVAGAHDFRAFGASPAPSYPNDATFTALQIPTLVIFGGRSVYHDADAAAARARHLLTTGKVEMLPTASHAVAAELSGEVNRRILGFIERLDGH